MKRLKCNSPEKFLTARVGALLSEQSPLRPIFTHVCYWSKLYQHKYNEEYRESILNKSKARTSPKTTHGHELLVDSCNVSLNVWDRSNRCFKLRQLTEQKTLTWPYMKEIKKVWQWRSYEAETFHIIPFSNSKVTELYTPRHTSSSYNCSVLTTMKKKLTAIGQKFQVTTLYGFNKETQTFSDHLHYEHLFLKRIEIIGTRILFMALFSLRFV